MSDYGSDDSYGDDGNEYGNNSDEYGANDNDNQNDPEHWFNEANYDLDDKNYETAISNYNKCISIEAANNQCWKSEVAYGNIIKCYILLSKINDLKDQYLESILLAIKDNESIHKRVLDKIMAAFEFFEDQKTRNDFITHLRNLLLKHDMKKNWFALSLAVGEEFASTNQNQDLENLINNLRGSQVFQQIRSNLTSIENVNNLMNFSALELQ